MKRKFSLFRLLLIIAVIVFLTGMYYIGVAIDVESMFSLEGYPWILTMPLIILTPLAILLATYRSRVMPNASESGILPALTCRGEVLIWVRFLGIYGQKLLRQEY